MPSKIDVSDVSLLSNTEDESLCSVIVSCWLRLASTEKPSLNEKSVAMPFLRPGPKLLVGELGEELHALLETNSGRRNRLLANEYARR